MKIYKSIDEFNLVKDDLTDLSYVPTMGNLHKGHISLIDSAKKYGNEIISSIYINSLQFNDENDFINYPKTLDKDIELLKYHGCDHLLIPDDSLLDDIEFINAPFKSNKLCGLTRSGHFDGVLTILNKFFKIIRPHIAIFGKKDYQQLILIKDFIKEKNLKISIIGEETIREINGLALSSRNSLLSNKDKFKASKIFEVLNNIKLNKNDLSIDLLNSNIEYLESCGLTVDYLTACDTETLDESFNISEKDILVAVAAKLGDVRLIDNIIIPKL